MDAKLSARLLIVLSMVYGVLIATLAALGLSSAATTAALIGGLIVGGLWTVRAIFTTKSDTE